MAEWSFNTLKQARGITLVEILIAMALMGFVSLSISNFVIKSNVQSASLSMRFKEASEVHAVIQDIQADLHRGALISPNSFNRRLEYTTYEPATGTALKKVYAICYYSAVPASTEATCPLPSGANTLPYLKLSLNGGANWGSPYRISGFNKYRMTGTPRFLYSNVFNGCYDFPDDNANGVRDAGDATVTQTACGTSPNSSWLVAPSARRPEKSQKVILANFAFTTGTGNPEALRSLPSFIFIAVAPGLVANHAMAAVAPGVKDQILMQSFSTDPAVNLQFPTGFAVGGLAWDPGAERLFVGSKKGGRIYQTERHGVQINDPIVLSDFTINAGHPAIEADGKSLLVMAYNASVGDQFYRYSLSNESPLSPLFAKVPMDGTEGYRFAMAYDNNTPQFFYVVCSSGGNLRIQRYNKFTGMRTGTALNIDYWALPAAYNSGIQLGGLFVEPVTGNFYTIRNEVYTSGGRRYVDIYKITRAGAATLDFSIDLTDFNATTGNSGFWGMAYDPVLNRIFLSDDNARRVYEIIPPKIITPRI